LSTEAIILVTSPTLFSKTSTRISTDRLEAHISFDYVTPGEEYIHLSIPGMSAGASVISAEAMKD
jgi:hypothetical protein